MKNIIFSVALLSAGLAFTSCSQDLLEIEQKSTSSTDNFYKSDADAESAVTAMYATFAEEIGGNEGIWNAYIMGLNYSADDVFAAGGDIADHTGFRECNEFRFDASFAPVTQLYNHIYKSIYSANLVINYFDGDKADTPIKKEAVAQAKVMRAWAHMLAAQVYYQPPIVDHLIVQDKPTNAESQKAIFDWCIKECDEAMSNVPERQGKDDQGGAWYATKGFAQFVAGKCALFAGENEKAVSELKPLVTSGNYDLVPGNRFRDLFHVEGDGCEEKIFEINFTGNSSASTAAGWAYGNKRGRWMVSNVLNWRGDDLVDKNGTNPQICAVNGWGGGSINQDFAHKMLANDGDSYRRKATFLTSDEFFYDPTLCPWKDDVEAGGTVSTKAEREYDLKRGVTKSAGSFSRSDVMEVKMMMHPNDEAKSVYNGCNNTNLCLARLGEAYLLYAEACINTNDLSEAKTYINKIQNRAGSKTVSSDVNLQVLQDEKEYELWFEGCRWFDIVRWGIAKQCYDKVLDNIPYQWDEFWETVGKDANDKYIVVSTTKPHKLRYEVKHPFKDAGITLKFTEGKNEYWPIPQTVIEVNDQMHQVRGWANQ